MPPALNAYHLKVFGSSSIKLSFSTAGAASPPRLTSSCFSASDQVSFQKHDAPTVKTTLQIYINSLLDTEQNHFSAADGPFYLMINHDDTIVFLTAFF